MTKELTFEKALEELDVLTKKLETGEVDLDKALKIFERGIELKKHCEKILKDAKLKVEKIVENKDDGSIKLENITPENSE